MSVFDFQYFRRVLRENGYELVRRGSTVYIRRRPWTRDKPTRRMLQARGAMKLASKTGTGSQGLAESGLPVVAERNKTRIPEAMMLLKVTTPERRREVAAEVAKEIGLDEQETMRLVKLVS